MATFTLNTAPLEDIFDCLVSFTMKFKSVYAQSGTHERYYSFSPSHLTVPLCDEMLNVRSPLNYTYCSANQITSSRRILIGQRDWHGQTWSTTFVSARLHSCLDWLSSSNWIPTHVVHLRSAVGRGGDHFHSWCRRVDLHVAVTSNTNGSYRYNLCAL